MTVMHKIFHSFEERGIEYCHFKSNQHLNESFEGKTDFDVLADVKRNAEVTEILLSHEGKRFESPVLNNYPGIENWLVFDADSGIIYHLHLHYQLLTGTIHIKEYLVYWYPKLLKRAVRNVAFDIMTSSPEDEMILLLSRIVLKSNYNKWLKYMLTGFGMPEDIKREFLYLRERLNRKLFEESCTEIYGEELVKIMASVVEKGDIDRRDFFRMLKLIHGRYEYYRRCSSMGALLESLKCEIRYKRYKKKHYIRKKVAQAGGGLSLAFVGIDGSGKSTTVDLIYKWLSKKIETCRLYMGTGEGAKSPGIRILKVFAAVSGKLFGEERYLTKILKAEVIAGVTADNRKKLIRMNAYRTCGGVTVMDRFPQTEIEGINDGIKLGAYERTMPGNRIHKLAKAEKKNLQVTREIYPDVIFRLNISLDTCMKRKDAHTDREHFQKKISDLEKLKYPMTEVIEIDAEQDYEAELLQIKREIWKRL